MIRRVLRKVQGMASQSAAGYLWEFLMDPGPNRRGRTPFGAEELKLVRQALASQNLCCVDGQMVPRFEKEFAMAYGVPYAVASTSGTAAIHVAVGALDLEPGSEIITAPITDLGTIIPIISQNCIPVFADIDETFNMDPADVERKITPLLTKTWKLYRLKRKPISGALPGPHDIMPVPLHGKADWRENIVTKGRS